MNETNWPALRLPQERLDEMRGEAVLVDRNPVMGMLAQVILLVSGEHLSQAHKLLRLVESEYPVARADQDIFRRLLAAAVLARASKLAAEWLSERFRTPYRVVIEAASAGQPADVAIIRINGPELRFQLSPALFEISAGDMILGRWAVTFPLFDAFMTSPHRVDGSVVINLLDSGSWPGLAFCEFRPGYYLIPDPHYMIHEQYKRLRLDFRSQQVPWEDRAPVAYWRGSTTGMPMEPAVGWRSLPRIRLAEISAAHSDFVDAGITRVGQISDPGAHEELRARNLMRPFVSNRTYQQYRYQIDIDGNANAWDGFVMRLMTGSPVLKVTSPVGFEQWYYSRLKPWVNFVPIETDMSDLVEKVTWLRANDDMARKIGEAGRDLAKSLDEREISRSAPVIAAAIRAHSGGPLIDLRFGTGAPGNGTLLSGWHKPDEDGVGAVEPESNLALPRPPGFGDYVLMTEISPEAAPQNHVAIMANGEMIALATIAKRETVYSLLPRSVAAASEALSLSFRCSNGTVSTFPASSVEGGAAGMKLHRIGVAAALREAWDGYKDIGTLVNELNAGLPYSIVHDLGWDDPQKPRLVLPPGAVPRTLRTYFDTILYADRRSGRVRHGDASAVPRNLFLVRWNNLAILARDDDAGGHVAVRLRPEGPDALRDDWTPWTGGGLVRILTMAFADPSASRQFVLSGSGLFACAEPNGEFTLSRVAPGPWETFTFEADSA